MNFELKKRVGAGGVRVYFLLPPDGVATGEDLAMLQALYSRDATSIEEASKRARTSKSGEFMHRFYVGYGHDSIGDLAKVTICIEGLSLFAAKAIQHDQLYDGQETSTRYIDFSRQPRWLNNEDALHLDLFTRIQENLLNFYTESLESQRSYMAGKFGLSLADPVEKRAANAAALDVLGGFLPIGLATNLSWVASIRTLNGRLNELRTWGFPDLTEAADLIEALFQEHFPKSFSLKNKLAGDQPSNPLTGTIPGELNTATFELMESWPEVSNVRWESLIDFRSWRDLARHRSVRQSIMFPTGAHGWECWYCEQLAPDLQDRGRELLEDHQEILDRHGNKPSYATPMAFRVPMTMVGPLDKFRYIIRLRTMQTVHPTARANMQLLASGLESCMYELGIKDRLVFNGEADWLVSGKRGAQTITEIAK